MSKQFIVEMNDTEYCAIKATPEKYKTLAHKILDRGTLVKTGHWIKQTLSVKPFGEDTVLCDQCAFMTDKDNNYNYCPNCGAKMERDDDE